MQIQRKSLFFLRFLLDITLIVIVFFLSIIITYDYITPNAYRNVLYLLITLLFVWAFYSKSSGLYYEFRSINFVYELTTLLRNIFVQVVTITITVFGLKLTEVPRMFIIYYSFLLMIALGLQKYLFRKMLQRFRTKGRNLSSILMVGAGSLGRRFFEAFKNNPHFGYKWLGFLDDDNKQILNSKYLGNIEELEKILITKKVDNVIVALPHHAINKIKYVINVCQNYPTRITILPNYFHFSTNKYYASMFGNFPVISVMEDRLNQIQWRVLKRGFDLGFTLLIFIIVFSWLFPILIVLQKILNPGDIFYKATRWKRNGEEFICYKFRSMFPETKNISETGEHIHTQKEDHRVTSFGKFLRNTNLDELPQFYNVLRGEMSIVGPRPHDAIENKQIKDRINSYMWRHIVKPGVTGWAQIHGYRGGTSNLELMKKRTDFDLWYIENWNFLLDIQIIILTIWHLLKSDPNAY